jgi:hypothetical protein
MTYQANRIVQDKPTLQDHLQEIRRLKSRRDYMASRIQVNSQAPFQVQLTCTQPLSHSLRLFTNLSSQASGVTRIFRQKY